MPDGKIFDTHAHYDDDAFDADRDVLLTALPSKGVGAAINAAIDPASARRCLAMSRRHGYLRTAVGIHPECAARASDDWLADIYRLSLESGVCAIGEIGLDYHYEDACPRSIQKEWFRRQLALAVERDLPVIVHDRDAHEDTLRLLQEYHPQGVVHCFSGSVEMMQQVVSLGMYIGLGGVTTFANAKRPAAVAAAVPLDRLLLETDAPYMAPVPCRGRRCDSSLIAHTAAHIANLRGMDMRELLDATWDNACRLFRLKL
ncbi:MAG: TatD family hydrolase [Clostridia bacterium]|nr:TatD family hydrolase [Clostridia bacterium]